MAAQILHASLPAITVVLESLLLQSFWLSLSCSYSPRAGSGILPFRTYQSLGWSDSCWEIAKNVPEHSRLWGRFIFKNRRLHPIRWVVPSITLGIPKGFSGIRTQKDTVGSCGFKGRCSSTTSEDSAARLTNCTMYSPRAAASAPWRKDFAKALLFSTGAISTAVVADEEKMM